MFYVYRFLNNEDEVIYVGRTNNLKNRIDNTHFTSGHLETSCYVETCKIEYIEVSEIDSYLYEIYLINRFKPRYNKALMLGEVKTNATFPDLEWKLYKKINENGTKQSLKERMFISDEDRVKLFKDFLDIDSNINSLELSILGLCINKEYDWEEKSLSHVTVKEVKEIFKEINMQIKKLNDFSKNIVRLNKKIEIK